MLLPLSLAYFNFLLSFWQLLHVRSTNIKKDNFVFGFRLDCC